MADERLKETFFGHKGRPNQRGGSVPRSGGGILGKVAGFLGGKKKEEAPPKRRKKTQRKPRTSTQKPPSERKTTPVAGRPEKTGLLHAGDKLAARFRNRGYPVSVKAPRNGLLFVTAAADNRPNTEYVTAQVLGDARKRFKDANVTATYNKTGTRGTVRIDYTVRPYKMAEEGFSKAPTVISEEGKEKKGNFEALFNYWDEKMGGRLRKGTFTECVQTLSEKPGITDPEALCAWWHKRTTGMTPTQKYAAKGWNIQRGSKSKASEEEVEESFPGHKGRKGQRGGSLPRSGGAGLQRGEEGITTRTRRVLSGFRRPHISPPTHGSEIDTDTVQQMRDLKKGKSIKFVDTRVKKVASFDAGDGSETWELKNTKSGWKGFLGPEIGPRGSKTTWGGVVLDRGGSDRPFKSSDTFEKGLRSMLDALEGDNPYV